jgi:4-amino-4-deoxy-L-arabinose transferase-like glycosyltransferase
VILGLCLLLRGAAVLTVLDRNPHEVVQVDSGSYVRPALALLEDANFFHSPHVQQPEFVRTPGYPAFIALVYLIFGDSHAALLLVQVVVSTLTVLMVFLLGARMWSVSVGLLAAAMTVIEPLQWYAAGTILSESLATLLLMLVVAAGFRVFSQEQPELRWVLLLGVAIALATMVRPVTYYLPLFVIVLIACRAVHQRATRCHGARMIAVFLLPLVAIVGGWQFRNHEAVNSWRFSAVEAKNLYLFRGAGIVADNAGISLHGAQQRLLAQLGTVHGESQGAYYGRMYDEGLQIVTAEPLAAFDGATRGLVGEVMGVRSRIFAYLGLPPASGALEGGAILLLAAFYGLCLYGMLRVVRARRDLLAHLFVVGTAAYVLLVSAGPEATGGRGERFRSVIMPILILYGARGANEVFGKVRQHRQPRVEQHVAPPVTIV